MERVTSIVLGAIAAAVAVVVPAFLVEYSKQVHGAGFPYSMAIAGLLLVAAHSATLGLCVWCASRLLLRGAIARVLAHAGVAVAGTVVVAIAFVPLALALKGARHVIPGASRPAYAAEQHLYALASSPYTAAAVLILCPVLFSILLLLHVRRSSSAAKNLSVG